MSGHQIETSDRQSALRRKADAPTGAEGQSPVHPLLTLQSQVGNAQVARMLAQREADEDEVGAKHDLSLQREADEDEVGAKHDLAQRSEEDGEHVGIEGGAVGPDTAQRIHAARGGGSGLDSGFRGRMESGFGADFSDVRVHQDTESNTLTRRLTAHAFTTGSDIFLRGDASASDERLMAHELTHVVQQRSMSGSGGMSVGAAGDPHESHADAMAESVLSSSAAPAAAAPAATAQREADEDEVGAKHDLALQREADEDEVGAKHDLALQREADEDEVGAKHDLALQREADDDEAS